MGRFQAIACAGCVLLAASPAGAEPNDESHLAFASLEMATASAPADTILYDFGVAFGLYAPKIDLSVSFGGASAPLLTGDRTAVNFVPSVGYHIGWNRRNESIVQLFGAVRVPLQRRSGAGLPSRQGFGLAGEAGVRLWGCSTEGEHVRGWCFGVTIAARYQRHMSEFQMGPAVLPSGSAVVSFPVTFGLAMNPDI